MGSIRERWEQIRFEHYEEFLALTSEEIRNLIVLADHACQLGIGRALGPSFDLDLDRAVQTTVTIIGHALAALASGLARITEALTIIFEPEATGDMDLWCNILVERKILEEMPYIQEIAELRVHLLLKAKTWR